MTPGAVVLASGPLDPADWWPAQRPALNLPGISVVAPVDTCDDPPYSVAWIASVAQQLQLSAPTDPLVVVGHGSAGPLLPALARTQRASGRRIGGYVFVDATLPRPGPTTHIDLLKAAAPDEEGTAHERLHAPGGLWPPLDDALTIDDVRPRDHQFWSETLPPAIDWPDAPCAFVRTGRPAAGCGDTGFWARSARSRGWAVVEEADPAEGVRLALDHLPA